MYCLTLGRTGRLLGILAVSVFVTSAWAQQGLGLAGFVNLPQEQQRAIQLQQGGAASLNAGNPSTGVQQLPGQSTPALSSANREGQPGGGQSLNDQSSPAPKRPLSGFQRFVFENTGKLLYPFGSKALKTEFAVAGKTMPRCRRIMKSARVMKFWCGCGVVLM